MYLLDTNAISELVKPNPDAALCAWLDRHAGDSGIPTIVITELLTGVYAMDPGKKRDQLKAFLDRSFDRFAARIYPLDRRSAIATAEVIQQRRDIGRAMTDKFDAQIAGIARAYDLTLVTRNVKDFDGIGLKLLRPWGQGG
jgi:toxin FitB